PDGNASPGFRNSRYKGTRFRKDRRTMSSPVTTVPVPLSDGRAYDILIGSGLIGNAGAHIRPLLKRPRVVVVTDENVARFHLDPLKSSLAAAGIEAECLILPPGEQSKSFPVLEQLLGALLDARVDRSDKVIALGGGVMGDLVGF